MPRAQIGLGLILLASLASLASLATLGCAAQAAEIPAVMIDFDRPVAFTKPLVITVFHAFADEHTYYVLPNRLEVGEVKPGIPSTAVLYEKAKSGRRVIVALAGTIGFGGDYETALAEISKADANAKFSIVEPYQFSFSVLLPGSDGGGATLDTATITSSQHFEIYARASDITARILLIPDSYRRPAVAIVYSPTYHGVVRSEDGTPKIAERRYDIGYVANGSCAFAPERYISWSTDLAGCIYPRYSRALITSIQTGLRHLGVLNDRVDGVYGPHTNLAIKEYQSAHSIDADGIPTIELLERIQSDDAGSSPRANRQ